jgi:hypothetical protein
MRDQEQKKCFEPCLDLHAQSWSNFFVFGLLFSVPKVGGQEHKKLILAMLRTPSINLKNLKCG